MRRLVLPLVALFALAAGCGSSDGTPPAGAPADADAGATDAPADATVDATGVDAGADGSDASDATPPDAAPDAVDADADAACHATAAAADRVRKVVVAHPYDESGGGANAFEVLDLATDGSLSRTGATFSMGRAPFGTLAFTPDGAIGIAVQDDGSLGVVRFDAQGAPTVVHASFKGAFYAGTVVVEPSGASALVLDPDWRNHGGGLYRVSIACDGTLTDEGLVAPAKLARGLELLAGSRAVLAAADVLSSTGVADVHLLSLAPSLSLVASASSFGDDQAIVAGMAATHDGKFVLVGDNSEFSGIPNRVAVSAIGASTIAAADVLTPIEDPVAIVASPFDDAALVVSGYGNAFFRLAYDPSNASHPFALAGEVAYQGAKPQLPAGAVLVRAGSLEGHVLVAENVGVRQVRFAGGGAITDLGLFSLGDGLQNVTGAIGVQP